MGPPFFNRVNVPIGIFLLLLTGVGPLLAWRKTSLDSLRRNFMWPTSLHCDAAIVLMAGGMKPMGRRGVLLLADGDLVACCGAWPRWPCEFWRGGRVIARQTATNVFSGMVQSPGATPAVTVDTSCTSA